MERKIGLAFGVDLDNVICDTDEIIREILGENVGRRFAHEEITDFDYAKSLSLPHKIVDDGLREFHYRHLRRPPAIHGVSKALELIQESLPVIIATSRPAITTQGTIEWLRQRKIPYDDLWFVDSKESFADRFLYFIDDSLSNAMKLASVQAPTVYLLDKPWNQSQVLPTNLIRVKDWEHCLQLFVAQENDFQQVRKKGGHSPRHASVALVRRPIPGWPAGQVAAHPLRDLGVQPVGRAGGGDGAGGRTETGEDGSVPRPVG